MASTYTTNLGIEKIGTGEQSGAWGTTTNTNFDLIDQAVNGVATVTLPATGSDVAPNVIDVNNGTVSDGRNKFIEFSDGGDLGGTAYVQLTPNDAEKVVFVRNSLTASRSILIFQGTYNASNDFELPAGKDAVVKFDGAGASATVTNVFDNMLIGTLDATNITYELSYNEQTGTTYTFVLGDQGKLVTLDNASAISATVPPNSSVAYPIGTKIDLLNKGAGQVTVVAGAGVTINTAQTLLLRAQWSAASLIKLATDTWVIVGDLEAA